MKALFAFGLAASLALNAGGAYLLLAPASEDRGIRDSAAARDLVRSESAAIDGKTWSGLQSDDLPALIKRLQASGFPPNVVRAIVAAELRAQTEARIKQLMPDSNRPYWKNAQVVDPKAMAEIRQIERDERKTLNELLGRDPNAGNNSQRQAYDYLPADKVAQLTQVLDQFNDRRTDLFSSGFYDSAKMKALEKEQHEALAQVLTPDQLLEYDLRNSGTAQFLRNQLGAFDPSEAEFRAIYQLQAAFNAQYGDFVPGMTAGQMRQRNDAQNQLNEQIKAVLSPDRAAVYDRDTDGNYRTTTQLVARLNLPPETSDQLYAIQKDFEQQRTDLFRNAGGDRSNLNASLAALQQQALTKVTPLLGSAANVDAYQHYGGSWLRPPYPLRSPRPPPGAP